MTDIIINNLEFSLSCIEEDNDVTIKVFDNDDECGQGLFSIQCDGNRDEEYHLYKWFNECNENDDDHCFPICIELVPDDYEDDEYYRIKIVGVDEI